MSHRHRVLRIGQLIIGKSELTGADGGDIMRKAISLILVIILILGCIGFIACGNGGEEGTTPPPSGQKNGQTPEQTTPSTSSSGLSWSDVPIYSGADQVQKGSWSIPPAEGDYSKVEWRYYETGDDISDVAGFYRGNMPGKGWEEMGWVETPEMNWGMYSKNNEQDAAMVWIGSDDGKTFLALMRASK